MVEPVVQQRRPVLRVLVVLAAQRQLTQVFQPQPVVEVAQVAREALHQGAQWAVSEAWRQLFLRPQGRLLSVAKVERVGSPGPPPEALLVSVVSAEQPPRPV